MIHTVLFALWFFLPAGPANFAPVLANPIPYFNRWKTPMDFGKSFRGRRILGDNKTWRGLVSGIVMGIVVALIQYYIWVPPQLAGHSLGFFVCLGALLGFGALVGDALESFAKRQIGVKPGDLWFPFDQIDYIVGGILASLLIIRLPFVVYVWILVLYFGLHIVFAYIGYALHLKDKPI